MCRLPSGKAWCLPIGGWIWILSLWLTGQCLGVGVFRGACGLRITLGNLPSDGKVSSFSFHHMVLTRKLRRTGEAQERETSRLKLGSAWPLVSWEKLLRPIYSICRTVLGFFPEPWEAALHVLGEQLPWEQPSINDEWGFIYKIPQLLGWVCVDNFEACVL